MKNGFLVLCTSLFAVGCAQQSATVSAVDPITAPTSSVVSTPVAVPTIQAGAPKDMWAQRNAMFNRMSAWRMQGKVGLQVKQQSWSFSLSWLQQGNDQYEMNIKNPLTGSVMAYLKSSGSVVNLKAADGKEYQDSDAERLLKQRTGFSLPVSGLRYWARGIASPSSEIQALQLDNSGRPTSLQQEGWVVTYSGYQNNSPSALPSKMSLERASEQMRVKVVAKDWKTRY
jgi:outer membrane lipoprotein LolB